jgi:hypothetical protein
VVDGTLTKIGLCEMHKDTAKLADFISPASWDRIVRKLAEWGKPVPVRRLTTLRFERIGTNVESMATESATATQALPF